MDCILRLTATARAHPFALLRQDRGDRIAGDVQIDVPIATAEHVLPPCCAAEIQVLAFRTPAEQAAALVALHALVALGDDVSAFPADLAPHAWTVVVWRMGSEEDDFRGRLRVFDHRGGYAQAWAEARGALAPSQRLALLAATAQALEIDPA